MLQLIKKIFLILFYRLICPTVKIINNPETKLNELRKSGKNLIFAVWHESTAMCFYYYRGRQAGFLREASAKGEVLAAMGRHFGYRDFQITDDPTDRTSARGTIQLIKYLREGHDGVVALDGPNGPYHEPKKGIFTIAKKTNSLVIPIGVWYQRKWLVQKRWDKYQIPKFFTKCFLNIGDPFPVPEKLTEDVEKNEALRLGRDIDLLSKELKGTN